VFALSNLILVGSPCLLAWFSLPISKFNTFFKWLASVVWPLFLWGELCGIYLKRMNENK